MSGKSDLPFIMLVLPDRIPVFHVDLPDNRPVKETNDETFSFQLRVLFASKVIMTESFGFLPDKRPVNLSYIYDVHSTEGRFSLTES